MNQFAGVSIPDFHTKIVRITATLLGADGKIEKNVPGDVSKLTRVQNKCTFSSSQKIIELFVTFELNKEETETINLCFESLDIGNAIAVLHGVNIKNSAQDLKPNTSSVAIQSECCLQPCCIPVVTYYTPCTSNNIPAIKQYPFQAEISQGAVLTSVSMQR